MIKPDTNNNFKIIAKTFAGLEEVLGEELGSLGAKNIKLLKRAVMYEGNTKLLYESNLKLRSALRILKHVGLKTSKRITLFNGPLETKFYKYSLYKGSKKFKLQDPK